MKNLIWKFKDGSVVIYKNLTKADKKALVKLLKGETPAVTAPSYNKERKAEVAPQQTTEEAVVKQPPVTRQEIEKLARKWGARIKSRHPKRQLDVKQQTTNKILLEMENEINMSLEEEWGLQDVLDDLSQECQTLRKEAEEWRQQGLSFDWDNFPAIYNKYIELRRYNSHKISAYLACHGNNGFNLYVKDRDISVIEMLDQSHWCLSYDQDNTWAFYWESIIEYPHISKLSFMTVEKALHWDINIANYDPELLELWGDMQDSDLDKLSELDSKLHINTLLNNPLVDKDSFKELLCKCDYDLTEILSNITSYIRGVKFGRLWNRKTQLLEHKLGEVALLLGVLDYQIMKGYKIKLHDTYMTLLRLFYLVEWVKVKTLIHALELNKVPANLGEWINPRKLLDTLREISYSLKNGSSVPKEWREWESAINIVLSKYPTIEENGLKLSKPTKMEYVSTPKNTLWAVSCSPVANDRKWSNPENGIWAGIKGIVSGYGDHPSLVQIKLNKNEMDYQVGSMTDALNWKGDWGIDPNFYYGTGAISYKHKLTEERIELSSSIKSLLLNTEIKVPVKGQTWGKLTCDQISGMWHLHYGDKEVFGSKGLPEALAYCHGGLTPTTPNLKLLYLVRVAVILMGMIKGRGKDARSAGYRWLGHYALGTGKTKVMPDEWIKPFLPKMISLADQNGKITWPSSQWDGVGFEGRPHGFYTIGGFTGHYNKKSGVVSLEDIYDWHPMVRTSPNTGKTVKVWCISQFSFPDWEVKIPKVILKVAERLGINLPTSQNISLSEYLEEILPEEYYSYSHFFRVKGLSNKLWADLELVGAKPFKTVWSGKV